MTQFATPIECGMGTSLCPTVVAAWTVGIDWFCLNENSGIPLGPNGYRYLVMQV